MLKTVAWHTPSHSTSFTSPESVCCPLRSDDAYLVAIVGVTSPRNFITALSRFEQCSGARTRALGHVIHWTHL